MSHRRAKKIRKMMKSEEWINSPLNRMTYKQLKKAKITKI
mgnify:CR=1 FL=1